MEQRLRRLFSPAIAILLGLAAVKYALPLLLPVLLGLGLAAILSPLTEHLQQRTGLRRSPAALLTMAGVLLTLIVVLFLVGRLLLHEMELLYNQLPSIVSALSRFGTALGTAAEYLARQLPDGAGDAFRDWADTLTSSGGTLAETVYNQLFRWASGFLSGLPDTLLFLLTTVLSAFFAALELPRLQDLFLTFLPERWLKRSRFVGTSLRRVLGGWCLAQLKLMVITFFLLLTGFLLLRIQMPLVLALTVSLLDALPLFGTGTILIPWGLLSMAAGSIHRGAGLLLLYGLAALTRNVLEPRLLGSQMGVSPLLTLLAIYAGYRAFGFGGMLVLPVLTMLGAELLRLRFQPEGRQENQSSSTAFSFETHPERHL